MNFFVLILIALSLAMDAFAVSVSNGIAIKDLKPKHGIKTGLYFGFFQFAMPLIGWALGTSFSNAISSVDHWVAFILLGAIGGKMIWDACHDDSCGKQTPRTAKEVLTARLLTVQAIATSIDALVVGVSFAMLQVNVWFACTIIGVIAFLLSFLGSLLGKKIGCLFRQKAAIAGGIILIGIGLKILLEHLFAQA